MIWGLGILLFVGLLYLFFLLPRYTKKDAWAPLAQYQYAHRGLHDDVYPENTLVAYQQAIEHGYGFEFDVQRTKDDVLVIMHDHSLLRACGVDKLVDELTYEEIKGLTVFNSAYHLPLFTEVLELVNGKVPLIIEIKQFDSNCRTCELVSQYLDSYQGAFCVESFHPFAVKWFKDHRPAWIRGQLSGDYHEDDTKSAFLSFVLENLLTNVATRPDFVAYDVRYIEQNISFKLFRDLLKGHTVLWTIRDVATFRKQQKKHDLLIFENFRA